MTVRAWRKLSIALFLASLCGSCAVPRYDVPYVEGTPSATSIVRRLEYELLDLVRDDTGNQKWLLTEDYQVAVTLSLEVNDTGGLAPSASYLNPLSKVASFAFGGSGTLSESRDHNFTENLQFSFREIYKDWKRIPTAYPPPVADTNLAGNLGIKDFVAMAETSPGLAEDRKSPNSVFGGSVQFLVTKSVSALGPTWSLVHFKGPGGVNLSEINTDKMTLAFARGENAGKPLDVVVNAPNNKAYLFLQQLLTSSINSQLLYLQSTLSGLPTLESILPLP